MSCMPCMSCIPCTKLDIYLKSVVDMLIEYKKVSYCKIDLDLECRLSNSKNIFNRIHDSIFGCNNLNLNPNEIRIFVDCVYRTVVLKKLDLSDNLDNLDNLDKSFRYGIISKLRNVLNCLNNMYVRESLYELIKNIYVVFDVFCALSIDKKCTNKQHSIVYYHSMDSNLMNQNKRYIKSCRCKFINYMPRNSLSSMVEDKLKPILRYLLIKHINLI